MKLHDFKTYSKFYLKVGLTNYLSGILLKKYKPRMCFKITPHQANHLKSKRYLKASHYTAELSPQKKCKKDTTFHKAQPLGYAPLKDMSVPRLSLFSCNFFLSIQQKKNSWKNQFFHEIIKISFLSILHSS